MDKLLTYLSGRMIMLIHGLLDECDENCCAACNTPDMTSATCTHMNRNLVSYFFFLCLYFPFFSVTLSLKAPVCGGAISLGT